MNKKVRFRTEAPLIKYHQKRSIGCSLKSFASAFHCIGDNRAVTVLAKSNLIMIDPIDRNIKSITHFANTIMKNKIKL